MEVSPPVTVFTLVWVPHAAFRVHAHVPLASLQASSGFDALASLHLHSLGRKMRQWRWCHPFREWPHGEPLATGPVLNQARSWVRLAPTGTLHQLRGDDGVDLCLLVAQPVHPIGGGWWQHAQGFDCNGLILAPLMAGGGNHSLGLSLGDNMVHHQYPLYHKHGLMPQRLMRLGHGSCLVAGELVLLLCCLTLGIEVLSIGSCLSPFWKSASSLE
jgi:hypothetical protein